MEYCQARNCPTPLSRKRLTLTTSGDRAPARAKVTAQLDGRAATTRGAWLGNVRTIRLAVLGGKVCARQRVLRQRLGLSWAEFSEYLPLSFYVGSADFGILDSPRWKKPVGDRLGIAAFNTVYGGSKAYTGPTLAGCTMDNNVLTVQFNTTLLRGDTLQIGPFPGPPTDLSSGGGEMSSSGSQMYVQINASLFCIEKRPALNSTGGALG